MGGWHDMIFTQKAKTRAFLIGTALWLGMAGITGCGHSASPSSHSKHPPAQKTSVAKPQSRRSGAPTSPAPRTAAPAVPVGNVKAGAALFQKSCQSCHGPQGSGSHSGPALKASALVISRFGTQSALEGFIAHNMPASNPGSLSPQQAADAAAYVWHLAKEPPPPKKPLGKAGHHR